MASLIEYRYRFDLLIPVRRWLNSLEIHDSRLARHLCRWIPASCPFEHYFKFWGGITVHVPPLCKLNPLYDEVVYLRFRALSFLADECSCDVT